MPFYIKTTTNTSAMKKKIAATFASIPAKRNGENADVLKANIKLI